MKYVIQNIIFVFAALIIVKKLEKMQRQIPITLQPVTLNPLKDLAQVNEIDYRADFDNLYSRMDGLDKIFQTGKISYNMLKYICGLVKIGYQGQLHLTETKRKYGMNLTKAKK